MQFRNKRSTLLLLLGSLLWVASGAYASAQGGPPGHGPGFGSGPGAPPLERSMRGGFGRWWNDPKMSQQVGITADQKQKMDDIFQQSRLQLIDLKANVEKQEVMLEPIPEHYVHIDLMVCMLAPKLAAVCLDTTSDRVLDWLPGALAPKRLGGVEIVPLASLIRRPTGV